MSGSLQGDCPDVHAAVEGVPSAETYGAGEPADERPHPASDFLVFGAPLIGEEEIAEVVHTLRSGWIGTGPKTAEFEHAFAEFVDARHAIGTNSGTAALHLALDALEVGPGGEVVTTPLTFVATVNVIEHCGATPVFADVRFEDGNLDPALVADRVNPRTQAILPVHYAGVLADVSGVAESVPNVPIVADAAHATEARGATSTSAMKGAVATAYSFYVTKNLVTGEGGMLVTDDDEIAARARVRRLHGLDNDAWARYSSGHYQDYELVYPGYKYNMTDMQAALGIPQLARLTHAHDRRAEIWQRYNEAFSELEGVTIPPAALIDRNDPTHARHLYTLWLDWDTLRCDRQTFVTRMRASGVGTGHHFRTVHLQQFYMLKYGFRCGDFPIAEWIAERTISIPLSAALTDSDVERVVTAVRVSVGQA